MGLKTVSEQFREDLFKINLQTPPDIVVGLTDLGGSLSYTAFKAEQGQDTAIHSTPVADAGNVLDISSKMREFLFKRNLQTPSDIEEAIIDLSANQSETMRNLGSIGTDTTINWRSAVVDVGTIDNAAMVTRLANLSRNKPRDTTDPSESNLEVAADGYNYSSLLSSIGEAATINNFTIPNVESISSPTNKINTDARALDLKINRYIPDEYLPATIRENILNEVYKRTTYVTDYTNSLKNFSPIGYNYYSFYNLNSQASLDGILSNESTILQNDTALMNIAAYMLHYNLQARFDQNLYKETLGKLTLNNQNYNSDFPNTIDPLELIKIAKDPLNNILEKNYTITVPRNFVGKTAQFLLGLEGVVSPFDLWESVDLGGKDLKPSFLATNEGIDALNELDPTSVVTDPTNTAVETINNKKDDEALLKKTGGGQRWSLYENLLMNKYSPKFDTRAELLGFQKTPKGYYYLGSESSPPIDILQARDGVSIINNNALSSEFNKGYEDLGGYEKGSRGVIWGDELMSDPDGVDDKFWMASNDEYSFAYHFRPSSLMDITQKLTTIGGVDSPIRSLKTKFRDGKLVYSKGNAVKKVDVKLVGDRNQYSVLEPWENGFCRTWTKLKPYHSVKNLVRYGELIRRERNSVIDRDANYNIFPSKLNVGTLYDQEMLGKDGIKGKFADKNFDKVRARKYMFSIENLAWKDSDKFSELPAYEQGSNGGRVMWFPPYGLSFNETSNASWTKHEFLGRPEPIYTYNNTERSGTLSWMVIVDHPSILNVLVQKELFGMNDEQVDAILDAFFAGCLEYDIFELARIWGVFSNNDIAFFKDVIDGKYPYPANITNETKTEFNYKQSESVSADSADQGGNNLIEKLDKLQFFFPNDMPYDDGAVSPYNQYYDQYREWLDGDSQTSTNGARYDYCNTIGNSNADKGQYFVTTPSNSNDKTSINLVDKFSEISSSVALIKKYLETDGNSVIINFNAFASTLEPKADGYNIALAARRALSVAKYYAALLGLTPSEPIPDTVSNSFTINLLKGQTIRVTFKADFANGVRGKTAEEMLTDVNWNTSSPMSPIIYKESSTGATVENVGYVLSDFNDGSKPHISVLSYPASYARRVQITASTFLSSGNKTSENPTSTTTEVPSSIDYSTAAYERKNVINKRDIATRILNKLIGENEYFEYLKSDSPTIFNSLKEKLKYFSPAFHSMTPEGLNGRLTFMNQCMRPGDTIKSPNNDVVNTAFGKPPVCILRIGDFYNTRMIINSINIEYSVVGSSVTYDLNPEGIGVQPMIAKITASVTYIGGSGLREPVAQLQNALSYNYYANADIYESMSHGQTDPDERYLENLELAYNRNVLDIVDLNLEDLSKINVNRDQIVFEQIGTIADFTKYPVISVGDEGYNNNHRIKEDLAMVQYYEVDYEDKFKSLYTSYNDYMTLFFTSINNILTDNPFDFFALEYGAFSQVSVGDTARVNFGARKDGSTFSHNSYPALKTVVRSNAAADKNYFVIGYDLFNKINGSAQTPKLHLYPQVDDRIINPVDYNLQTFAGIMVPKYVDLSYVSRALSQYKDLYIKYLSCEEWFLFDVNPTVKLRKYLDTLPIALVLLFRDFVISKFNNYYNLLISTKFNEVGDLQSKFIDLYSNVLATNSICNGIDGGVTADGSKMRYLEVVPNVNSESTPVLTKFVNDITVDDCLNKYPANPESPANYSTVKAMADDYQRGLFNYLEYQMSIATTPKWFTENKLYFDFSDGAWKINGVAQSGIGCKTTFEKLNFERLYFGSISQDTMFSDTLSGELKSFEISASSKLLRIDNDYAENRLNMISNVLGIPITNNTITYNYFSMNFVGDNSNITNSLSILTDTKIKLEDVIFYGFIKEFIVDTNLDELKLTMITAADGNSTSITNINSFITKIKGLQSFFTSIDRTLVKITDALSDLSAVSSPNDVTPASGGYKMKMFEVAESRANTYGRKCMTEYLQFKNNN